MKRRAPGRNPDGQYFTTIFQDGDDAMTPYGQGSPSAGRQNDMTTPKPGRPRRTGPTKVPITIRLDIDVLAALKLSGPGWQTRVNRVVREWILTEPGQSLDNAPDREPT